MKLAIELDQSAKGYGRVHRAGCRDLRDAESIGEASARADIRDMVESLTGWDWDLDLAPCVKLAH